MQSDGQSSEQAARETWAELKSIIDAGLSFRVEAGAGSGKTFSLVQALQHLIRARGRQMLRKHQQVACITYTNVAKNEILSRIDHDALVSVDTIHGYCWSLIKPFQRQLNDLLPLLKNQPFHDLGSLQGLRVEYEFGFRSVKEDRVCLHHDDVLPLTAMLMGNLRFRQLWAARYPILFIDEYQDTDFEFSRALVESFIVGEPRIQVGLFGDHWQKIWDHGCGLVEHTSLVEVKKSVNYRSSHQVVQLLNRMRPELPQVSRSGALEGTVIAAHTNRWSGKRRADSVWKDDLPSDVAHQHLTLLRARLENEGWDFAPERTRILMLTHNVLAAEQGYAQLAEVFKGRNDRFAKKEDDYIKYLIDVVEPIAEAFLGRRYGDMFAELGSQVSVRSVGDKRSWAKFMDELNRLRWEHSVGDVLDYIAKTNFLPLSDRVQAKEEMRVRYADVEVLDKSVQEAVQRIIKLRAVAYREVVALRSFLDGHSPFSTKHGVKGEEYDNVLVVVGKGWNNYNFNRMLEIAGNLRPSFKDAQARTAYERARNLFYVACSRPKLRLAVLFTLKLSEDALVTVHNLFGGKVVALADSVQDR